MGGKTSTTTQGVSIPKEVMDRYNAINTRAENVAGTPFQTYSEDPSKFVAQLNTQQQQGIGNVNAAAGAYAPYFEKAYGAASAGMQSAQPGQLNTDQYMNPFQQQVIDATMKQMGQANQQAQSGALGTAIQSGAFGGDRAGIAAANLANQQGLAMGSTLAGLNAQNYGQALATAQQQQGVNLGATQADLARQMQGGQFYAGLGTAAQQAGLQGAEAQINAGTLGQQTEQAGLSALYNQFQQKNAYPFQVAQFLANIGMGTGALSGSTTTTTQPGSFFSDRRLKEDVQRIGEGDNGLPIYKYRYKGEPDTHIGFMADEVEKVRPEAVGLHPTGYKTVDYDRATKAEGGVAGPYGSSVGSQPGVAGYVPQAYLPVGELMMADPSSLDHARQSLAQQLEAVANMSKNVRELDATWDWAQDKWGSDPKKDIVKGGQAPTNEWRGGVAGGYADGGAAYLNTGLRDRNPVEKQNYLSDIVSGQEDAKRRDSLQSPGSVPQARTTGQDVADLAKVALAFMGMNRGGRTGYATRGGVSEEDMRRLSEMRPGDPTDILPSGVVPQPSRITKPVTYEPQAPNWKSVATTSPTPGAYEYDTNYGMVRDMATGQLLSDARSAVRNDTQGVPIIENGARSAALDRIEDQLTRNKSAASTEALKAQNLFDYASDVARQGGSYQDARKQFPELYDAYRGAQRRLDSANAVVMPSSITNRFGDQANYMIAEGYQPSAGMVTGVMPRDMGAEAPAIIPGSEAAPVRTGVSAPPMTTDAMTPPSAQVQPSSLGFSGLRPVNIEDAGISTGSIRPRARPANLDTMATVITPTGLRPQPRPDDLAARYATPVPTITAGLGGGGADRMPVAAAGLGSATAPANVPAAPTVDGGVKGPAVAAARTDVTGMDPSEFYRTHIIRQESGGRQFGPDGKPLTSSEGAVGVGQVIESTGPEAAALAGLPWDRERWMYDADYNAAIGEAYFLEQYRKYGTLDKAAAAYNAGPGALDSAIDRATALGGSYIDYLPAETQNYVAATTGRAGVSGGATPRAEQSTERAGLAAGLGNDKAYEDRNMLGKMMYDPETNQLSRNGLLSLASGIGAMLSSPSQYFLPSLGLGMQGFAGTYAGLEKQAADIGQTKAETRLRNVEADRQRFIEFSNGRVIVNFGDGRPGVPLQDYLRNPQAYSTGDAEKDRAILAAAQAEAASGGTPSAAGAESPAGVRFTNASQGIIDQQNAYVSSDVGFGMYGPNIERAGEMLQTASDLGASAMNGKAASNELAKTVAKSVAAGDFGSVQGRQSVLNTVLQPLNSVLTSAGIEAITPIDGTITSQQILSKLGVMRAGAMTPEQQRAASVFEKFVETNPSLEMTEDAAAEITAALQMSHQADIDRAQYFNYMQSRLPAGYNPYALAQGFNSEYSQILQEEKGQLAELYKMAGDTTPLNGGRTAGQIVTQFMEDVNAGSLDQSTAQEILSGILRQKGIEASPILARWFIRGM